MTGFEALATTSTVAVRTFRRSGRPVDTPVWATVVDDVLYFGTPSHTHKVARLRANARVELARSDGRGNVDGPWLVGEARLMTAAEFAPVKRRIDRRHRFAAPVLGVVGRVRRWDYIGVAVTPTTPPGGGPDAVP